MTSSKLIIEIPPLGESDSYYLQERYKPAFNYPIHKHHAYELNFVENCSGARRIVGDSMEELNGYDLALIGCDLEHIWEQHQCKEQNIHEITIQLPHNYFPESLLKRRVMAPVKELFECSKMGVAFGMKSIMTVYDRLMELSKSEPSYHSVNMLNEIFYDLAAAHDYHILSSSCFAHVEIPITSHRVQTVKDYIDQNYAGEIRMETLAALVSMTPNALSRFFKQRTNLSISEYISEVRIGHASMLLMDNSLTIVEISYKCGFNSISNFNRTFKAIKGITPTEFRESYKKNSYLI